MADLVESQEVVDTPQTEEEYFADIERKFLAGELKEEDESKSQGEDAEISKEETTAESTEETDEEESSDDVGDELPTDEGPAIKENKRLREKNREVAQQLEELRSKVEKLEAPKEDQPETIDSKIKASNLDELLQAEANVEDLIHQARAEEDTDKLRQLNEARVKIKKEILTRPAKEQEVKTELRKAESEWGEFEEEVLKAHPSLKNEESALRKSMQAFAQKRPHLMKQLGNETGGMMALAAALVLNKPSKSEGKGKQQQQPTLVEEMEKIAENSVSKTPASQAGGAGSKSVNVDNLTDEQMDDITNRLKSGTMKLSDLG